MSRKDELFKLAQLFHSQANRMGTTALKQKLRRMAEYYQNEAKQLNEKLQLRLYDDPIRRRSGHREWAA
jgi:hypothetical protein